MMITGHNYFLKGVLKRSKRRFAFSLPTPSTDSISFSDELTIALTDPNLCIKFRASVLFAPLAWPTILLSRSSSSIFGRSQSMLLFSNRLKFSKYELVSSSEKPTIKVTPILVHRTDSVRHGRSAGLVSTFMTHE